jgi:hypothetical protein
MKEVIKTIDKFYGGMVRDDRSKIVGAASNMEELDIFANADYIQAEQIVSTDAMPASTEIVAYTAGDDDTVYGYGQETGANKVRLVSVATGGATDPGAFATLDTESDTTNLYTVTSDFKFFRTIEASNPTSLYFIKGASSSWYIARYNIGASQFQRWTGSAWSNSGSWDSSSQLTGLSGSFMRPTMKVIYGELFICHGRYIAKIDKDGVFTEKAYTLPSEWEAIDLVAVSDVAIILSRNKNKNANVSKGFWWDLTSTSQFDDSFTVPMGGPQWIVNHKETIKILTAINGTGRIWQMSGAFPGAVPLELPSLYISNLQIETSTQPISSARMVGEKDKILYFGLWKQDKNGIYALGQLDSDKPNAFLLSKRFDTTNYANHKPYSLLIQGPNYYAAFEDNGTSDNCRCESNNSPSRSSTAVYESIWIDDGKPYNNKDLYRAYVTSYPLVASTSLALSIASDYNSSYTAIKRADDTIFNTTSGILGFFKPAAFKNKKAFKAKVAFVSSTTSSPKLQSIGLRLQINDDDLATQ